MLSPLASCLGLPVCFQVVQWVAHLSFLHLETFCDILTNIRSTQWDTKGCLWAAQPLYVSYSWLSSGTHLAIHTTATNCAHFEPMDHSLLSQVAVSVLNPKSGLRVTLVCSLAEQHIWHCLDLGTWEHRPPKA